MEEWLLDTTDRQARRSEKEPPGGGGKLLEEGGGTGLHVSHTPVIIYPPAPGPWEPRAGRSARFHAGRGAGPVSAERHICSGGGGASGSEEPGWPHKHFTKHRGATLPPPDVLRVLDLLLFQRAATPRILWRVWKKKKKSVATHDRNSTQDVSAERQRGTNIQPGYDLHTRQPDPEPLQAQI